MKKTNKRAFPLGDIKMSVKAKAALNPEEVSAALKRHMTGEWITSGLSDYRIDDEIVKQSMSGNFRLASVFIDGAGVKFWCITRASFEVTTVLLSEEVRQRHDVRSGLKASIEAVCKKLLDPTYPQFLVRLYLKQLLEVEELPLELNEGGEDEDDN